MTFDLGVWKSGPGLTATAASFLYSGLCQGERGQQLIAAADSIKAFYDELITTWPEVTASSFASRHNKRQDKIDSPWSGPLLRAEDYVLLSCEWHHAEIVLAYVTALAGKNGLTVFDPQSEEVYLPES